MATALAWVGGWLGLLAATLDPGVDGRAAPPGSVSVEVVPQFGRVTAAAPGRMAVLVRIRGKGSGEVTRPPLDLAIVLDRSGSMTGEKILAVKQAALDTVRSLREDDRVSLVTYASDVRRHGVGVGGQTPQAKRIESEVLAIRAEGNTVLGSVLGRGIKALSGLKREPGVVAQVLLLSDGLANEGESNADVLASWAADAFRHGIGVSTLGVGADYAEDLMTKVADAGGGRYHFIEHGSDVPRVLADEFAGLTSTVARGVELRARAGVGAETGRVYGYPTTADGDDVVARIGAVGDGQTREVVVEMRYEPAGVGPWQLGTFVVEYDDTSNGGVPRAVRVDARVLVTPDAEQAARSENTEVTVRLAELEAASRLQIAMKAVESGAYDEAERILEDAARSVREKASRSPSPGLDQALGDLSRARGGVDKAKRSTKDRKVYLKSHKSAAYEALKK